MPPPPDLDPGERDVTDSLESLHLGLEDLPAPAVERIRLFLAERAIKGGSSPSDIAALYTAPEIVGDALVTRYLDRQFVHQEIAHDWRSLQDRIGGTLRRLPPGASPIEVLTALDLSEAEEHPTPRSIFDDPDDLDEDLLPRLADRDPLLEDLVPESRRSVARLIVQEALARGIAPIRYMELRDALEANGDERAIQYLDLPYDRGERPQDWSELYDQASRVRQRMDGLGQDSLELWLDLETQFPDLETAHLLRLMEQRLDTGR